MSSRHFQFKEHDTEGLETLKAIKDAGAFNSWMYSQIAPFVESPALEIGSGIGNISKCCLADGHSLTMTDIRSEYIDFLKDGFSEKTDDILQLDLVDEQFDQNFSNYFGRFKTVFALNVIEHIEDDNRAIQNATKLLCEGGKLIILVPAHAILYNKIDSNLFHFKRYGFRDLSKLMETPPLKLNTIKGFNGLGIAAWVYGGLFSRKGVIAGGDMKLYNRLVPFAKWIDKITFFKLGLSLIAVSRKVN
ncbi:MAG: class I SAM-dependent methyltransferase [Bacteroidota bacterium]|jgi:SAM-dependent methyltransferase